MPGRRAAKDTTAAIMVTEPHDALRSAGADEGKAREAATAVADFAARIIGIDAKAIGLDRKMGAVDGRVSQLTWMVGINIALTTGVIVKLLAG